MFAHLTDKVRERQCVLAVVKKQHPLLDRVGKYGDVHVASSDRGFIDRYGGNTGIALLCPRLLDLLDQSAPQPLGTDAQQSGDIRHGHLPSQHQCPSFKQQREPAARIGPRHGDLGGLAATATGKGRNLGMKEGSVLNEVQVLPFSGFALVDRLRGLTTCWAWSSAIVVAELKVDPSVGGRESNVATCHGVAKPQAWVKSLLVKSIGCSAMLETFTMIGAAHRALDTSAHAVHRAASDRGLRVPEKRVSTQNGTGP